MLKRYQHTGLQNYQPMKWESSVSLVVNELWSCIMCWVRKMSVIVADGNETWIYHLHMDTKHVPMQWKYPTSPGLNKHISSHRPGSVWRHFFGTLTTFCWLAACYKTQQLLATIMVKCCVSCKIASKKHWCRLGVGVMLLHGSAVPYTAQGAQNYVQVCTFLLLHHWPDSLDPTPSQEVFVRVTIFWWFWTTVVCRRMLQWISRHDKQQRILWIWI